MADLSCSVAGAALRTRLKQIDFYLFNVFILMINFSVAFLNLHKTKSMQRFLFFCICICPPLRFGSMLLD